MGLETARRMWDKDYEIVVTTHLDTNNFHGQVSLSEVVVSF